MPHPDKHDRLQRTILLVDGDPGRLRDAAKELRDWGYDVATADDARSALVRARQDVDLIVADYGMPGMDGLEFLAALRREGPAPPVILLTSHADVESYLKAVSMGVLEYLCKPVSPKELRRIINVALHPGQAEAPHET